MSQGKEKGRRIASPPSPCLEANLSVVGGRQVTRDLVKGRRQLRAEARHRGDRGNRDQSGNQAVFDGGGASFVTKQVLEKLHGQSPGSVFGTRLNPPVLDQAISGIKGNR